MDSSGAAEVWSLQIAAVIFIAGLGTVLVTTVEHDPPTDAATAQGDEAWAESFLELLAGRAGSWSDVDAPERLGFAAGNGTGLNGSRLQHLVGFADSGTPGVLDLDEAAASLAAEGIDGSWQLRIRPLAGSFQMEQTALESGRLAYVGAWNDIGSISVGLGTPDAMMAEAHAEVDSSMLAGTAVERAVLASLGMQFTDQVIITTDAPDIVVDLPFPLPDVPLLDHLSLTLIDGDVYPAEGDYLQDVLVPRLDQYDVLVIGSDVDGTELTPSAVKDAIAQWVAAGGQLMVLGSADQDPQWLQPIFHVASKKDTGTTSAPDPQHDLLNDPHQLSWSQYPSNEAWELPTNGANEAYNDFEHILAIDDRDTWTISEPGFAGDGRVMLTSYRGHEIELSSGQGLEFFDNSIRYLVADLPAFLFLDYGPGVPDNVPVGAASMRTLVWTDLGPVPVELEMLTW